jgi:predicted polyphosphate/ATP-dependent NAD kinase
MKDMKMGLVVNPIAGMGGKVGLKGTDNILKEALARGAEPLSPSRAIEFLKKLHTNMADTPIEVLTCPGIMGEDEAEETGWLVEILPMKVAEETSADDTKTAVKLLTAAKVDLIVFVGGDGTAKDILDELNGSDETPVLGVPSGVKMYSGIFAINPSDAVEVVLAYAQERADTVEFEVMDVDEDAIRDDVFSVKLHGYLKAPLLPAHIQGSKQISPETDDEKDNQTAIARFITEEIPKTATLILGPGTTVKRLAELLDMKKTVLGVDIYTNGEVTLDVNEKMILKKVKDWQNTWIILSPIGHQGILLGRGNQQISPRILRHVSKQRMVVVATKNKLRNVDGCLLRVDTGDAELDTMLRGYIRVVTDYKEWRLMPVR